MTTEVICSVSDLVANSGVCALVEKDGEAQQVAIFFLPDTEKQVYAIGNWDPVGQANVLSRGIVGNLGDQIVVASPLYKQHFSLTSGECLEEDVSVPVFDVYIEQDNVVLAA
jgi:nitrite reductase (NADH) small subunit